MLKSDQYTQNAEFERDVRSLSFEHSINTELNRYSIQATVIGLRLWEIPIRQESTFGAMSVVNRSFWGYYRTRKY